MMFSLSTSAPSTSLCLVNASFDRPSATLSCSILLSLPSMEIFSLSTASCTIWVISDTDTRPEVSSLLLLGRLDSDSLSVAPVGKLAVL